MNYMIIMMILKNKGSHLDGVGFCVIGCVMISSIYKISILYILNSYNVIIKQAIF